MIIFILVKSNSFTILEYKRRKGLTISDRLAVVMYNQISSLVHKECSMLIFADFERLNPDQTEIVAAIQEQIAYHQPGLPVLNQIKRVKLRYQLLRECYEKEIIPYNVYKLDEDWSNIKYPVFVRQEDEHIGPLTPLLHHPGALKAHTLSLELMGFQKKSLIITEFCDVSDESGFFNKYSASRIGEYIIPRYYDCSKDWIVKTNMEDVPIEKRMEEYRRFFYHNPYENWIKKIFNLAHIEYGRIDFSVKDGKPILWEINLNPSFGTGPVDPAKHHPEVQELRDEFHKIFHEKLIEYDEGISYKIGIPIPSQNDHELKESAKKVFWRNIHQYIRAKRQPYKQLILGFQTIALFIATCLLKLFHPKKLLKEE